MTTGMRDKFEAAVVAYLNAGDPGAGYTLEHFKLARQDDEYSITEVSSAWWAWQESRAATQSEYLTVVANKDLVITDLARRCALAQIKNETLASTVIESIERTKEVLDSKNYTMTVGDCLVVVREVFRINAAAEVESHE